MVIAGPESDERDQVVRRARHVFAAKTKWSDTELVANERVKDAHVIWARARPASNARPNQSRLWLATRARQRRSMLSLGREIVSGDCRQEALDIR